MHYNRLLHKCYIALLCQRLWLHVTLLEQFKNRVDNDHRLFTSWHSYYNHSEAVLIATVAHPLTLFGNEQVASVVQRFVACLYRLFFLALLRLNHHQYQIKNCRWLQQRFVKILDLVI